MGAVISPCKLNKSFVNSCEQFANKKYDGYCAHCFINLFPNDPRSKNMYKKTKELKYVHEITKNYSTFLHDKPLYVDLDGGCCVSKRRIDLRKLIHGTILAIEIDENQHKYYCKVNEKNRYNDLFMDFSGKYVFLRINPDKYKINDVKYNPHFKTRIPIIINEINKQITRIKNGENKNLIEIHHLFYDQNSPKN